MESEEEGFIVVAKLDDGENLLEALERIVEKHDIKSGLVLSGLGMLRNFKIGYFDGEEHRPRSFHREHELLALHGSITTGEATTIHLHCALSNEGYDAIGGHLIEAEVAVVAEVVLAKLSRITLGRRLNPKTGLKELSVG